MYTYVIIDDEPLIRKRNEEKTGTFISSAHLLWGSF